MHLGLNLIYLVPGETGGRETYANELVRALRDVAPQIRMTAFVSREAAEIGTPIADWAELAVIPVHARNRLAWAFGEQTLLPRRAVRAGVDVLHSLGNTAPLTGPYRRVVTLHDLLYHFFPRFVSPGTRTGTKLLVPLGVRRSHRVITVSGAVRDEVVRHLGVPLAGIDVVPHGVGAVRRVTPTDPATLRLRYRLGPRPFAYTAALRLPHKNLDALLEGLARIPAGERPLLVLSGHGVPGPDPLAARTRSLGLEEDVRLLGWLPAADVEALYAEAAVCVIPSLYEGFGLPVLEAMARRTPVACSDIPVLREVAGGAAQFFDPHDPTSIAGAVRGVLGDAALADRLRRTGEEHAARYTWRAAAEGTVGAYERALRPRAVGTAAP